MVIPVNGKFQSKINKMAGAVLGQEEKQAAGRPSRVFTEAYKFTSAALQIAAP